MFCEPLDKVCYHARANHISMPCCYAQGTCVECRFYIRRVRNTVPIMFDNMLTSYAYYWYLLEVSAVGEFAM